ncbi:MAG TPA: PDZ domain-containing protein [bacterium]|nr:PDZ domain-containing protein [bacterium]
MNRRVFCSFCLIFLLMLGCAATPKPVSLPDSPVEPVNVINYFMVSDAVLIKATLNDIPDEVTLLISLCQGTTLFPDSVERLGIQQIPNNPPNWKEGDPRFFQLAEPLIFHQNNWQYRFDRFTARDAPESLSGIGTEFDGYLGSQIFQDFIVTIDPAKLELRTYAKDSRQTQAEALLPGATIMDTGLYDNAFQMFTIYATLNGQANQKFIFDTVMTTRPSLTMETARQLGFTPESPDVITFRSKIGENEYENSYWYRVKSLKIGSYELGPMVFTISESSEYNHLGMSVMQNFRTTIDYQNNKMVLVPLSAKPKPNSQLAYGVGFSYINGKTIITGINSNSSAVKAGIQYDDEVLSMNGIPLKELGYDIFIGKLTNLSQDTVVLEIRKPDGTVRKVKLKKTNLFR